jgi:Ca2+/Na+ antiporter
MYGDMHVSSENACVGTSATARKADINIPYKVDISFLIICAVVFLLFNIKHQREESNPPSNFFSYYIIVI